MTHELLTFAIVTPSFNQAHYLDECIESVLGQGYPNLEYVIMDGGSTDGSQEIIKKYEKHLTYWQSQPDGGQYKAISEGFRRTSGEIMAWLNADDKYHPLAFAKAACAFSNNPAVRWLTGRMCYWDSNGDLIKLSENIPVFSRMKYLEGNFDKPYIQQESTFWHRSLWQEAGATVGTNEKLSGDLGLWCRFFRHESLYTLDTCLGGYRHYGNQRGITMADDYHNEASGLIEQERAIVRHGKEMMAVPPAPLTISRERLAPFLSALNDQLESPSVRSCWRHYTENLIGIVNKVHRERLFHLIPFIENELLMLGLVKPSAITLTADRLDELSANRLIAEDLRSAGDHYARHGDDLSAATEYRKTLDMWPGDTAAAANLLRTLWRLNQRQEAMELIVHFLPTAAHKREFVMATAEILIECDAPGQAIGVCDEYLMTNPHDVEIRQIRETLR
jgi:glycosyltransferase involved in cell wall biosynthesis